MNELAPEVCREHRAPDCGTCDEHQDGLWVHPRDLEPEEPSEVECRPDPWLINDRIQAATIRWFGPDYERATTGFGAFLCHELGLTHEARHEALGAGTPTVHRWVTAWERVDDVGPLDEYRGQ